MNISSGMSVAMVITKMSEQHDKHIQLKQVFLHEKKNEIEEILINSSSLLSYSFYHLLSRSYSQTSRNRPLLSVVHIFYVCRLLLGQRKIMLCQLNFKLIEKNLSSAHATIIIPYALFRMFPYTQFIIHEHVECKKSQCNEFI